MRRIYEYLSSILLVAALAIPLLSTGCTVRAQHRDDRYEHEEEEHEHMRDRNRDEYFLRQSRTDKLSYGVNRHMVAQNRNERLRSGA